MACVEHFPADFLSVLVHDLPELGLHAVVGTACLLGRACRQLAVLFIDGPIGLRADGLALVLHSPALGPCLLAIDDELELVAVIDLAVYIDRCVVTVLELKVQIIPGNGRVPGRLHVSHCHGVG